MSAITYRIKFLQDHVVKKVKEDILYKKGEEVTLNVASARHFVVRGVAEIIAVQPLVEVKMVPSIDVSNLSLNSSQPEKTTLFKNSIK